MNVQYSAIFVCALISMVFGALWYGPLFGKKWMEICGVSARDLEARKKMQKNAGPLYLVQFLLTLFQLYVLSHYISGWGNAAGWKNALWIWAGFLIPTIAAGAMWNNDSARISWARFWIQAGYYGVLFVIFGLILTSWR